MRIGGLGVAWEAPLAEGAARLSTRRAPPAPLPPTALPAPLPPPAAASSASRWSTAAGVQGAGGRSEGISFQQGWTLSECVEHMRLSQELVRWAPPRRGRRCPQPSFHPLPHVNTRMRTWRAAAEAAAQ